MTGDDSSHVPPSIFLFDYIFLQACKDLAKYGYNESAIPSGIKEWCSGKLFSLMPKTIVQQIFSLILTYRTELKNLSCNKLNNGLNIVYNNKNVKKSPGDAGQSPSIKNGSFTNCEELAAEIVKQEVIDTDFVNFSTGKEKRVDKKDSNTITFKENDDKSSTPKNNKPDLEFLNSYMSNNRKNSETSDSPKGLNSPGMNQNGTSFEQLSSNLLKIINQGGNNSQNVKNQMFCGNSSMNPLNIYSNNVDYRYNFGTNLVQPLTSAQFNRYNINSSVINSSYQTVDMGPPDERRYKCSYCTKNYGRSSHLSRHIREHHQDIWYKIKSSSAAYQCIHCTSSFSTRQDKEIHMRQVHIEIYPYSCELCIENEHKNKRLFQNENDYVNHFKEVHFSAIERSSVERAFLKRGIDIGILNEFKPIKENNIDNSYNLIDEKDLEIKEEKEDLDFSSSGNLEEAFKLFSKNITGQIDVGDSEYEEDVKTEDKNKNFLPKSNEEDNVECKSNDDEDLDTDKNSSLNQLKQLLSLQNINKITEQLESDHESPDNEINNILKNPISSPKNSKPSTPKSKYLNKSFSLSNFSDEFHKKKQAKQEAQNFLEPPKKAPRLAADQVDRTFKCNLCEKAYGRKSHLQRHVKQAHGYEEYIKHFDPYNKGDPHVNENCDDKTYNLSKSFGSDKFNRSLGTSLSNILNNSNGDDFTKQEYSTLSQMLKSSTTSNENSNKVAADIHKMLSNSNPLSTQDLLANLPSKLYSNGPNSTHSDGCLSNKDSNSLIIKMSDLTKKMEKKV